MNDTSPTDAAEAPAPGDRPGIVERFREPRRAFAQVGRNRELRLLLLAWAGSSMGQWSASIAVTVLSYERAGAAAVALQVVLRMVPAAVAAPFMSTLADRRPRVRLMVSCDMGRVVLFVGMAAVAAAGAPLILVYLGSALAGVLDTGFQPAKQSLLPGLARDPAELTAANVASSSVESVSMFLGPALGGLMLAATSTSAVLVATALAVAWSALLVSRIREPVRTADRLEPSSDGAGEPGHGAAGESFLAASAAGIATVVKMPPVRAVVGLLTAQTFVAGLSIAMVTALALDELRTGEAGVGALNAAIGIGGVVGAVGAVTLVGVRGLGRVFAVSCVLWGVPFALIGALPVSIVAVVALAVTGLANTVVDVAGLTLLQRSAPEAVLARVFGVLESLILASVALGAIVAPVLLDVLGIRGALVAAGAMLPVAVALAWRPLRRLEATTTPVETARLALLRGAPMLAPLPMPVLERLAAAMTPIEVPAGEAVFAQGDAGDRFYLVESGAVEVLVDDRRVREQRAGDGFGEIALLRDIPRTATVRAVTDTTLQALPRDAFLEAVGASQQSGHAAENVVRSRLAWARPASTPA